MFDPVLRSLSKIKYANETLIGLPPVRFDKLLPEPIMSCMHFVFLYYTVLYCICTASGSIFENTIISLTESESDLFSLHLEQIQYHIKTFETVPEFRSRIWIQDLEGPYYKQEVEYQNFHPRNQDKFNRPRNNQWLSKIKSISSKIIINLIIFKIFLGL